ncbi:hypothetical protein F5877DRAFT_73378, partial [Lentinula edodes]
DSRTVEEKNDLLRWAKEFDASHPYISREELARRRQASSGSLQSSAYPSRSSRTSQGLQLFDTERRNDVLIEKGDLLRWAEEFDASHPYIPREELERRRKAKEEELAGIAGQSRLLSATRCTAHSGQADRLRRQKTL